MAKYCGSLFLLQVESPSVSGTYLDLGGFQSNSLTINNEQVDVTTKGTWLGAN